MRLRPSIFKHRAARSSCSCRFAGPYAGEPRFPTGFRRSTFPGGASARSFPRDRLSAPCPAGRRPPYYCLQRRPKPMRSSRRDLLAALLAAPFAGGAMRQARAQGTLALTPACDDGDAPTPAQTEGPYFTPNSPEKRDFAADSPGDGRVTLAGFALDPSCRPLPGALIELWHCDGAGVYDNAGFLLRGHQFTDSEGRWRFDTVVPGVLPGPHAPLPRKGPAPRRPAAHHPALFPRRARQRSRPHLRRAPARRSDADRRGPPSALRPRPRLIGQIRRQAPG